MSMGQSCMARGTTQKKKKNIYIYEFRCDKQLAVDSIYFTNVENTVRCGFLMSYIGTIAQHRAESKDWTADACRQSRSNTTSDNKDSRTTGLSVAVMSQTVFYTSALWHNVVPE